jgi:histidinol-phosphate aminotransferase
MFEFRPGLDAIKSYSIEEADWRVKLDANERAEALPAAVQAELTARLAALAVNRYPEIGQHGLRTKIAADLGLPAANIAVGNGSSEILAALCHAYGGNGKAIVYLSPSFSMYRIYTQLADSRPVTVALDDAFNLDAAKMVAAARAEKAGLVILCNPNNPTGGTLTPQAVEQVVAEAGCPVVVDEAYFEFFQGQSALGLLSRYPNVIVARTFSKAYGLAAARVGYAAAGESIMAQLNKVLLPYHVNAFSLTAAAVAWEHKAEFDPGIARTMAERDRLTTALQAASGIEVFPSSTNFILVRLAKAGELSRFLAAQGIGVRDFSASAALAGCLRVTVGTAAENDAFLHAVSEFSAR